MRVCIVGGGLAGPLLAWRLARAATTWDIDLILGDHCGSDATAVSGGAVRAYETHPEQRMLASVSMLELLASATLREWGDYRQLGSVYLRRDVDDIAPAVAEIELMLPHSCRLVGAPELTSLGWADVRPVDVGIVERYAGYISPTGLRTGVLSDAPVRQRVGVRSAAVTEITLAGQGAIGCGAGGERRDYDVVVIAAGAWTGSLLRANGLPAANHRTKSIQYSIYPAHGWRPPHFVDEVTGIYGRPTADGGLLLGLPTDQWDVDPNAPPTNPDLHADAAQLAQKRFPRLRLGPALVQVGSSDSYADHPTLGLRSVVDTEHQLFTFSGGAGGSVKTVLAASHRAAIQLVESDPPLK